MLSRCYPCLPLGRLQDICTAHRRMTLDLANAIETPTLLLDGTSQDSTASAGKGLCVLRLGCGWEEIDRI